MKGSQWWAERVPALMGPKYWDAILDAIVEGWQMVWFTELEYKGLKFKLSSAPLAIGEQDDFVFCYGLSAFACDQIDQAFGCVRPTSLMLDVAANSMASYVGPNPHVNGAVGMTKDCAKWHNDTVQRYMREQGLDVTCLLGGDCKTYTGCNPHYRKHYAPEYWWPIKAGTSWARNVRPESNATHSGAVVQPEHWAHFYREFWDYSMAWRGALDKAELDGTEVRLHEVYTDPRLSWRVGVHGPVTSALHPEYHA